MSRPLSGIRAIDFGQYVAGPAAAMMLADFGAEVIRIDPPGGPRWRDPATRVLNRNKESTTLDLKAEEGRDAAFRLVGSADVVVENFRPGVIAAASGQFTDMGLNRVLMGINPSFSPLPLASAYGAVLGAMAARETSGRGDRIEVPLAAALMEGLAYNAMHVENLPERYKSLREREIERRAAAGEPMDMGFADLQELLDPFYRTYHCADGRPFYAVCSSHTRHPMNALKVLGIWEELAAEGLPMADPYLPISQWGGADCTLWSYPLTPPWSRRVAAAMKAAFRTKTAQEWERLFREAGVPGAEQRSTREWIASAHARESGLIVASADEEFGTLFAPGAVGWLKDDTEVLDKEGAREADRDAVLSSLGEKSSMQAGEPRGFLDGVRILDLTNVIARPTIAQMLSRFGAEVISVDAVNPTLVPWNTIVFGLQAPRGKRSLLADLKSPGGREVLERLIGWADAITINALDKQLPALGLDDIARINPDAILCQFDAWGRARGQGHRCLVPWYRCYPAADGWFFFVAPENTRAKLQALPELNGLSKTAGPTRERFLEGMFASRPLDHWRKVTLVAPNAVRPAEAPLTMPRDAPKYGEHSAEILAELGYGAEEIETLIADGASERRGPTTICPTRGILR